MRTEKVKIYQLYELPLKFQLKAYEQWLEEDSYPWYCGNKRVLDAFEKIFPIKINNWEYDSYRGYISFYFEENDYRIDNMKGIRLLKYLYNNYYDDLFPSKTLWTKSNKKHKSKINKCSDCPLTGYYLDMDILEPIYDFLKYPNEHITFFELINTCLNKWVDTCTIDLNSCSTFEYFSDIAISNKYEYLYSGQI